MFFARIIPLQFHRNMRPLHADTDDHVSAAPAMSIQNREAADRLFNKQQSGRR
jgi:hypothetical protein